MRIKLTLLLLLTTSQLSFAEDIGAPSKSLGSKSSASSSPAASSAPKSLSKKSLAAEPQQNKRPELSNATPSSANNSDKPDFIGNLYSKALHSGDILQKKDAPKITTSNNPATPEQKKAPKAPEFQLKSIFFQADRVSRVNLVFQAYNESQAGKVVAKTEQENKEMLEISELLDKLKPEKVAEAATEDSGDQKVIIRLPAYIRLNTLIYRSADQTKVWVNKKKYSANESTDEMRVTTIGTNYADIDIFVKDKKIKLAELSKLALKGAPENNVSVNEKERIISFRLFVNQYFNLKRMRAYEGEPDFSKANLDAAESKFYDPDKPETRFVSFEDDKQPSAPSQPTAASNAEVISATKSTEKASSTSVVDRIRNRQILKPE